MYGSNSDTGWARPESRESDRYGWNPQVGASSAVLQAPSGPVSAEAAKWYAITVVSWKSEVDQMIPVRCKSWNSASSQGHQPTGIPMLSYVVEPQYIQRAIRTSIPHVMWWKLTVI